LTTTLIIIKILFIPVFYNLLIPFKRPNLDNYFSPNQTYSSKAEGIMQTAIKQDGNKVYCELKFELYAIGPTEHLHINLDESVIVFNGIPTTKLGDKISKLNPADRLNFNKEIHHRMYNETNEEVNLRSQNEEDYITVEFAYSLAQTYPMMKPSGGLALKMFAKICVLDNLFDSVILGPPPVIFTVIKKIVKPYARLFGVTPYDDKLKPKK